MSEKTDQVQNIMFYYVPTYMVHINFEIKEKYK